MLKSLYSPGVCAPMKAYPSPQHSKTLAPEVLDELYLGCLKHFLCSHTCCPSAWNSLSPLAHLQISAHSTSLNSSVIWSVSLHLSEERFSFTVFLSLMCRFLYYFAHLMILQFIHLSLSSRVPSPLRKRTISLLFLVPGILSGK